MPQVSNHTVQSETKHGEITVNLNLTIKLEQDGTVRTTAVQSVKEEPDKFLIEIPEFIPVSDSDLISFGKDR